MKDIYKVSIIIPAYNVESYIEQCLLSALNQTLSHIEIIVIDDGSTDGTSKVLDEYARKYPIGPEGGVTIIHQQNLGVSAARNLGIQIAKGKYLYFLDSDDYIELSAMEMLYQEAEANELDLVLFSGDSFYNDDANHYDINLLKLLRHQIHTDACDGGTIFSDLIKYDEFHGNSVLSFMRRQLVLNENIYYNTNVTYAEDSIFIFQLIFHCKRVKVLSQVLYHYRQARPFSLMTNRNYLKNFNGYYALIKSQQYYLLHVKEQIVKMAILKYMGQMYNCMLTIYDMLSQTEKNQQYNKIQEMKKIAQEHHYFKSIRCRLFQFSENAFHIVRAVVVFFRKFK